MIDALPFHVEPPAIVQEVRKRRRSKSRGAKRRRNTALYVGAIIILTRSDGTPYSCQVTHVSTSGQWWCNPLN